MRMNLGLEEVLGIASGFSFSGLIVQLVYVTDENGNKPAAILNDWSLGYVSGFVDASIQASSIPDNSFVAQRLLLRAFSVLFPGVNSQSLYRRLVRLQDAGSREIYAGMTRGGADVSAWLTRSIVPMSWVDYMCAPDVCESAIA
ncbi:Uncharacterised protein [BD1-7 clade bacterium]|uniref:Uncharacterized protein n=1 Tax=BD1-7 clade bacterium TaxID=2029982 RepID=A0A5S9R104_9GAMM|nr:Uncharacterised protein [BD1-7 clade bacterium]